MFQLDRQRFGAFVAEQRRKKGITQKELAQQLSISDKAVSKWETGVSIPDVALLVPLAECLDVTVAELLECRRIPEEPMNTAQVEDLVKTAISYPQHPEKRFDRGTGIRAAIFFAVLLAAAAEIWALYYSPIASVPLPTNLLTFELLYGIFGGYFMLFVKRQLPYYYDQDRIGAYYDGIFRMNVPGVRFSNRNWPHIIQALRVSLCSMLLVFPPLLFAMERLLPPGFDWLSLTIQLAATLGGFFLPLYFTAKKYE